MPVAKAASTKVSKTPVLLPLPLTGRVVMELVGDGVNVNAADSKKRSPLHFAAVKGDASVVK